MVDVDKVLKTTVKKGKVKIGAKETKTLIKDGTAKLVVMAKNCSNSHEINDLAKKKKMDLKTFVNNTYNEIFSSKI